MRIVYALLLFIMSIVSCFFVWKTRKEGGLTVHVRRFLLCSVIAMVCGIVSVYSGSESLSLVIFGIYFTVKAWLLVFFIQFILAYTGNRSKVIVALTVIFACFVTVNAILNQKLQHAFSLTEVVWSTDGNRYLTTVPTIWYKILLGGGLAGLALCVIVLAVKIAATPPVYRLRYIAILCMIAVMGFLNAAFMMFSTPMDWSALFYAVFSISTWFFSTRYIKTFLLSGTLSVIVDRLDTGLVVLDTGDEPVYINERGTGLLNTDMSGVPGILEQWYGTRNASELKPETREFGFKRNGEDYVYSVRMEQLKDRSGSYNGCFFAIHNVTGEKERQRQEKYIREHDRLTNLYTQEHFFEHCERLMKKKPQERYLMVRTETEVFESIRSIYGKDILDAVVVAVGGVILKKVYGRGAGGRMDDGGFALFLPEPGFSRDSFFRDISGVLSEVLGAQSELFCVRTGICCTEDRSLSAEQLSERARTALRYLKAGQKNPVSGEGGAPAAWYTEEVRRQDMLENNLTVSFDSAMRNGELQLYLQPVQGAGGNITGAEAFVRWDINGETMILGDAQTLPEKNEVAVALNRFIWRQAAMQLARWQSDGKTDCFIAVNVPAKLLYFMDVCGEITGLLKEYGAAASRLQVIFTAEQFSCEETHLACVVEKLRKEGVQIILKDFGGCQMYPVFLKNFRFDGIRLDRRLVQEAGSDPAGQILLKSIIDLGRNLGVSVYADGIGTEKEYRILMEYRCDGCQGTFISGPVPAEDFIPEIL